jgi:putative salt-induced outer membrane protein YdiY
MIYIRNHRALGSGDKSLRMRRIIRSFSTWPPRGRPALLACITLLVIYLTTGSCVLASELHLSNGDRVTGTVILRSDGKIHFRSAMFGDFVVDEADAAVIDTPDTPVESLAGLPPSQTSKSAKPKTASQSAKQVVGGPMLPVPPPETRWKGKVEFGFLSQSGRSEVLNNSLRFEAELKDGIDSYRAVARYLYGETNGKVASDRQDASYRWRHDVSKRVFTQSLSSYARDQVTLIDLNLEQNGSMGYQVLQSEQHRATVGAGVTLQYREAEGIEPGVNILGEVFQDYSYKINGRLTITQAINALYSPNPQARSINSTIAASKLTTEVENYRVRFNSSLQGKMSERISLNLRYEYEYDNAIVDKESRTDQRITSSIGYAF